MSWTTVVRQGFTRWHAAREPSHPTRGPTTHAASRRPFPELPLVTPRDRQISLRALAGEATALIFLRHLGCLPCRGHLVEVSRQREQLAGRVICVTFAAPALLRAFERELCLGMPLFGDPDRAVYDAFGFGRGSVRCVWLDPRVWAGYRAAPRPRPAPRVERAGHAAARRRRRRRRRRHHPLDLPQRRPRRPAQRQHAGRAATQRGRARRAAMTTEGEAWTRELLERLLAAALPPGRRHRVPHRLSAPSPQGAPRAPGGRVGAVDPPWVVSGRGSRA